MHARTEFKSVLTDSIQRVMKYDVAIHKMNPATSVEGEIFLCRHDKHIFDKIQI